MNTIFKAIQTSFDLLDKRVSRESLMSTIEYMLKIANEITCNVESCQIKKSGNENVSIDINCERTKAHLTINVCGNQVSYIGTGPDKNDNIKTVNTHYYSINQEVIEWIRRNKIKTKKI